MDISVIIPVFNRAKLIQRTLDSVISQSHRPINLILVDNNSTDDTMLVLENYKAEHEAEDFKILIATELKVGAAAARNCGVKLATSEWIMFFDSDDVMDNSLISRYVQEIEQANDKLDIIMCRVDVTAEDGTTVKRPLRSGDILREHIYHSILSTQRYIVKRDFFIEAGAWNEKLLGWDDWELGIRLILRNPRVASITDSILVHIYSQADSITGTNCYSKSHLWELAIDEAEKVVRNYAPAEMQKILTLLEFKRITLAGLYTKEGSPKGKELFRTIYSRTRKLPHLSWAFPLIYRYVSLGGRGSAFIINILV
ncbi:MAG: glycosyltransferase family A protein [Muribaculaceae bacterium]